MPKRDEHQHRSAKDVPPVGRPRGAVWRSLQADGVVWEGQVLLVGDDVDLAARMIVTHRRIAFVRGGEVVLEVPRGWLRQEPVLRRDGVLELFVATPESKLFDEPQRIPLRMREGHPAAGHIIAMLAPGGVRRIAPDAVSALERARESATTPPYNGFWDGIESPPRRGQRDALLDDAAQPESAEAADRTAALSVAGLPPVEPPDRVLRVPSTPPRPANGHAFPIAGIMPRDQRRSPWSLFLRLAALTILLATAAALGAGRLNLHLPGPGAGLPAILAAPTATPPATTTSDPAASTDAAIAPDDLTAVALGVGGPAAQGTSEPAAATAAAVPTSASTAPAAATQAPPTAAPSPTPEPTAAPTRAAAAPPGAASPAAGAATPRAAAQSQAAAFAADAPPAQEIVAGPLRLAIATALRGESLPRYGLPPGSGDWVLLMTDIANQSDQPASLAMANFRLFDRGTGLTATIDPGVDVIASLAGFDPVRTAGDTISVAPGATSQALLLFLVPPGGSDDVVLLIGSAAIDLAPSLALGEASVAAPPELVSATVTKVENGGRITVEIDGDAATVQYLGISAPASSVCFAAESAAANSELVAGQQVWLEREATDTGADGALLRDVWVSDAGGNRGLVAARLLEAGAATAAATPPDTRYQAWLSAAEALARSNGAGLWSACPAPSASA